ADNNTRCQSGNLETCVIGQWVPQSPACSAMPGDTCFDPAPAGGTDAYCGNCLKGADRCNGATRQTCPNGAWTDAPSCGALGCSDPGGDQNANPPAYCGVCVPGTMQCVGDATETCAPDGSGWGAPQYCPLGCIGQGVCCTDLQQCDATQSCGTSLPNACGVT